MEFCSLLAIKGLASLKFWYVFFLLTIDLIHRLIRRLKHMAETNFFFFKKFLFSFINIELQE